MPALAGLDISPAVALEALYTRVCSAVRAATGTGALTLPGLDAACRQLLAASPLPDLPGPDADLSVDALYLATEIYPAGGHRMLLEQLIRSRPADTHKVVFTGLLNNTPAFGQARMADFGVPVFAPDPVAILWDKWMALRAHIAHCAPARIFLLHHSEDVIAALLAYEFSDIYKERLIFVRHADTVPSLGADLGNATHMAIRPAQAEVLLARWPALKLHHVPLCFDPATPLPRMVAETPVALTRGQLGMSRRQRLRNMAYQALRHTVWKSRRARFAALQYRARRQPVPPRSHTPLITATCGTEHKFERSGPFALPDIIVHVLRSGARGHIHVGPASPALRHACRDALRRAGLPSRRLQFTGEVPSVADALRAHRVTLFLGSFPVGGALSRAEAAWAGIPIALQQVQTGSSPYLVGADFAPEAVLAWHGPEDLAEQIAGWSPALFDRLSTSARRWFDQSLSPAAFAAAVTELVDALPREVARPHGAASSVENGPLITAQGVTEWVTQRLRVVHTGADAQVAHPARQVTIQRPRVVARTHIAPSVQNWDLPTIETHIWPNAIVVGGADGIVTQDGTWYDPGLKDLNPDQISLRNPGPVRSMENDHAEVRRGVQTGLIPEAIQGTGCYSHNYYHFMHEVLPRIWTAAHRAPFGTPVLTEDDLPAQCVQALRMILPHNTIEMVRRGQSVQVNRLYTSGMGTIANELKIPDSAPPIAALRYHPDLLTRLGKLGCIAQGGQAPTHLFLWRSSKVRVLRNRTRLRDRLEEQGFAIVDTASMGFANQIRMMGQAECIVAQSGAHLTNIAFAPKGCRIIPLFSDAPDINYRLWSAMGQMLGLDVVNVAGTKNAEEQGIHADFTVSPDLVLPLVGVKTSDVPSSASA
ncbi:glycosyltransferase family 61 protein, partial [Roseovarius gaetbuli]|uniref:glycosyltransferase family 61 protein n=1 Tax=Roseovarius gaetbuli TaxID=1356575 RepID=UPI000A26C8CD